MVLPTNQENLLNIKSNKLESLSVFQAVQFGTKSVSVLVLMFDVAKQKGITFRQRSVGAKECLCLSRQDVQSDQSY